MFSISSLAVTALNLWENDGYWLCFTAAFEMAVKPLFSKTLLLIPPSAWWYCCCDGFRLGVRWGGTCVRLAVWAGENGASIGHRSPEVGLSNRPQAEHSWTLHGHSEFTLPLLICYTKALAACRGGHMQQAAEGEIVLPFEGVGGVVKTELGGWAWRMCATEPARLLSLWFFIFGVGVFGSKLPVCTDWNQY